MGRIQRPIHRKASPTTVEKRLSQRKVGTTEEIHHKWRLVFRSFGYIPKRRRSQVISWAPSMFCLGLTLGCRVSRRATNPLSAQDHRAAVRPGAPHCRSSCWSRCPCWPSFICFAVGLPLITGPGRNLDSDAGLGAAPAGFGVTTGAATD